MNGRDPIPGTPDVYRIRVKGRLVPRWEGWFDRLVISPTSDGDTLLTGPIEDQAALHGVLAKVRDLGLPLISVGRVHARQDTNPRKDLS